MARTASPPPLGDYSRWADRFVQTCVENGKGVTEVIEAISGYAEAARDECATEVARWGADPEAIRQRSLASPAIVTAWVDDIRHSLGAEVSPTKPLLKASLARLFRDVRTGQIRDALAVADHQAKVAYQLDNEDQLNRWRYAESALRALLVQAESDADLDLAVEGTRWIALVSEFTLRVAAWAQENGWRVTVKQLERTEEVLGTYQVPMLIIQTERGAVMVEPVARFVMGAVGRIDVYAYPAMFRVMLLRMARNDEWRIRTDSGVFLPQAWSKDTFIDLVRQLTSAS